MDQRLEKIKESKMMHINQSELHKKDQKESIISDNLKIINMRHVHLQEDMNSNKVENKNG